MTNGQHGHSGQPQGGAAPDRKGLSPIVWIAIGCAGIVVLLGAVALVGGIFVLNKA